MARKSLILIGFSGVGKSTVGSRAANALGAGHYDTDAWMETRADIDIPQLVKTDIATFRKLEAEALADILRQEPGIISTGGGVVSTEDGRKVLQTANAQVIWLRASFDDSTKRITGGNGRERPLFADTTKARELYDKYMEWYEKIADHTVDASRPLELVVDDIVKIAQSA